MHPALIAVLSIIGIAIILHQVVMRIVRKAHPIPCPARLAWILDRRGLVFSPSKAMDRIGIGQGMKVLELGPGTGFLTVEASRRVGSSGSLYSLDIQPAMIAKVRSKVSREGLDNVALLVGNGECLPFADSSLDLAFLVAVLGEIPNKDAALSELNRVLRQGGVLSITELFPDPDYLLRRTTIALALKAGFEPFKQFGNFFAYTINFRKEATHAD